MLEKLGNVIATQTKALNELRDEYEELTVVGVLTILLFYF